MQLQMDAGALAAFLARDFGPDFAEQDRAARLFLYRGDMAAEWAAALGDWGYLGVFVLTLLSSANIVLPLPP